MQLVRAVHTRRVDSPIPFRQQERMQLFAADRAVSSGLVLEVDLFSAGEGSEQDDVARGLERVESRQLANEDFRVVIVRQHAVRRLTAHFFTGLPERSEERRVGKECKSR